MGEILSMHIEHKNGNFLAEVETVMWQFKKWYDKKSKHPFGDFTP